MTADEYAKLRSAVGLNGKEAAELFGVHHDTESSWRNGRARVPATVSLLLRYITSEDGSRDTEGAVARRLEHVRKLAEIDRGGA